MHDENLELCSRAMFVLSPHALFVDEADKEKWKNTKNKSGTENPLDML